MVAIDQKQIPELFVSAELRELQGDTRDEAGFNRGMRSAAHTSYVAAEEIYTRIPTREGEAGLSRVRKKINKLSSQFATDTDNDPGQPKN